MLLFKLLLFHLVISTTLLPTFSYYFTGYEIGDLYSMDGCFIDDATSWSITRMISGSTIYSNCGGTYILGGYNILGSMSSPYQAGDYFSRTYTGLSSTHTMVYFTFSMWQLDSWNGSPDYFQVDIDGVTITGWNTFNYGSMTAAQKVQVCGLSGSSYPDVTDTRTFGRVAHTGTSLTFKMISRCDQDSTNESLGFRALTIYVVENPTTTGATQAFCGISSILNLGSTWQCSCSEGQYLDSTSTCVTCDSSCSSCFGAGSNQCYECANNYGFDGTKCVACSSHCTTCSGTGSDECYECESGYLLYYNQCVLSSGCVSPLYVDGCDDTTCESPCAEGQYIYNNGTCANYCILPLQTGVILDTLLCIYPCASNEYLYWDGVCESSCDSPPLTTRTQAAEVYCDYGCASTGEYLYWDGSCSTECNSPLEQVTSHGRLFCVYPCNAAEYLYEDGTCSQTSCGLQYTLVVFKDRNFCDLTCDNYQLWNGTCVDTCDSPMRLLTNSSGTFCYGPCNDPYGYYYPLENICDDACYGRREYANYTYWICYRSNTTVKNITLSKLLHHLRYVDVEFPDKLTNISIMRGTNIFSPRVIYSMFTKVTGWPSRFDLPSVFEYYYLPSSFLANFGDDLILLGMILTISIIAFILEMVFDFLEGCPEVKIFFYRLRILTQWNLPLMIILHNTGDIFFFAVLEFRTLDLTKDSDSILSFILCLAMLILLVVVYTLGIYLAEKAHTVKVSAKKPASYARFIISWEKFQVLFRGFNDSSFFSRSFLLLYGVRLWLPMVIASFLYMIPLLQGIAFFMITACMMLYILCKKPLRRKIDLVNLFLIEFFILLSDASMIGLISLDMRNSDPDKARTFFGYVIIVCNYCLDVFAGIFMLIKGAITIRKALNFREQKKESLEIFSWLQLIFIPLQQGSLGFEQFQVYSFKNSNNYHASYSPEEASQIIDETSSTSTATNKNNNSELRGLALPTSGLNQSTIWDLNNSRSHLDGVRISRRRVAPFQPQPRTIELNTSSLDYIPDTPAYSARKRALNSYHSGSTGGSQVWTDTEVPQSRTNSSQRRVHPILEENQELSYNSVMLSHMSVNPLLSQKSSFPGSNSNRRAILNNSHSVRYQPEVIEEARLEHESDINWRSKISQGRRTRRRLVRDDDEIYPTIIEDPERNLRFKGNKNKRYNG